MLVVLSVRFWSLNKGYGQINVEDEAIVLKRLIGIGTIVIFH